MTRYAFQRYIRTVFVAVTLVCLICLAAPAAVHAQVTTTGPKFGSVDVQRILTESKARQRDQSELQQLVVALRTVGQKLQDSSARFLSEAEIRELAALYEKKTPTDADKKRISQLEDAAAVKSSTKRRLENTVNPTPDESKQLQALSDAEEKSKQVFKNLNDDFSHRLEGRELELNNKTVTEIKGVISKIAQEKGLAVVFDSAVAIYTANDITDDVIKQINK